MKTKALSLLFCLGVFFHVKAQDFAYDVHVQQINFSGSGYITILTDSTQVAYSTAHWRNDGLREPAAFVSGTYMNASSSFLLKCTSAPDSISVRAINKDTFDFPMQTVALSPVSGGYAFTYPPTSSTKLFFAGRVDYFDSLALQWEISFDKGAHWTASDTTYHKVYVTRSAPMSPTTYFKYFHTVLELSCRNAKGETTDTGIIKKCWSEFTDRVVLNHKGDSLHYYKTFNTSNTNLPLLLRYRNAQCYTFAQLFASLIKIQGVVRSSNYVFITPKSTTTACGSYTNRFLVKNWSFGSKSDSSACPSFPYRNTYSGSYITPSGYVFSTADVNDQIGVGGQCNNNPSSFFNNHQITKYDGVYYDACYGLTFSSLSDIVSTAFDGWGVQLAPGTYNFTTDMSQTNLIESISTF